MKLLIDIPEGTYTCCKIWANSSTCTTSIKFAIANGVILPEGHGDLIDRDELKTHKYYDPMRNDYAVSIAQIDWAETIIEADKESEA